MNLSLKTWGCLAIAAVLAGCGTAAPKTPSSAPRFAAESGDGAPGSPDSRESGVPATGGDAVGSADLESRIRELKLEVDRFQAENARYKRLLSELENIR